MERLDRETADVLKKGRESLALTKTDEWRELRQTFFDKVFELERCDLSDDMSDERLGQTVRSRITAAKILREFITSIEGEASSLQTTEELLAESKNNMFSYDQIFHVPTHGLSSPIIR